jgi:hypothetical protein
LKLFSGAIGPDNIFDHYKYVCGTESVAIWRAMSKTDISVRQLIDKVQHRELLLPEMQRRYVWPATRVRDLLDSLYRSYPSGTILVWETDEEIETRELAVKATKNPTTSQRLLLLDGQQRITSLAAILGRQPVDVGHKKRPLEILFNLEHPDSPVEVLEEHENGLIQDAEEAEDEEDEERDIQEELRNRTFVVASRALETNPQWISVSTVFEQSDKDILRRIGLSIDDVRWNKYSDRLQKVRKIQDYPYVMQTLEKGLSYEEVTDIFVRVNSLGIKLRGSDLAVAQISSRWKGFMALCEEFAKDFEDDEHFLLESGLLVRLLVAIATGQSQYKTVGKIPKKRLEESWQHVKGGLEFAINFVKSNAHVDSLRLLSSPSLLVPIAVYADLKKGKLDASETKLLLRWFYLAHMRGHYSIGSSENWMDADLGIIFKTGSLENLIKQLQQHVKQFEIEYSDVEKRGTRSPIFSMLYFVLRQNGAKDWMSGIKLSSKHVGKSHKLQYHHVFPKSLLRNEDFERKEINEIANMAFIGGKTNRRILNNPPSEYFPEDIIPKQGVEALASQLIPTDPKLWEMKSYRDFLDYRRKAIVLAIKSFMDKLE